MVWLLLFYVKNGIAAELILEIPRLMLMMIYFLKYIKDEAELLTYLTEAIYSFHVIIRITLPCILTEMINAQIEKIKITLNNKIYFDEDEKRNTETRNFLQYIETRRLQHKVWRVIPVDLRLPVTVFSMCITYLIVIVQFSHMYD
ncbi:uncharacterized protein LOC126368747 isoform X3 [Pectinophora gossypiella]|nr:uncharacterized protein LOC126368747 isoform X3 [Pectinophora gossypiella]